ncbi:acetyl-CoA carboxylase biotin carboxyl carrier protein subunit [Acidisoma cellulosilytica]|uniref:Acetyl-CoA carboxylase biotin carboxyl carrier protein subunit n=1 Tax=Acidisoma cellulosilyticum TaxID=2802395 RepID=A0A964E439_9PROT|nr:acetyl-CoA carboxylase biotin carboxyl carrier protein subunit [Acidisoma cellulosilyticum]MCB8881295.1 acetyl-CoA carboxylase biotin carboxyl carrier protein subunit [Acidisoma cellulosilyticum]
MVTEVRTQTAGNVWKVLVQPGDNVAEGDTLFIMEVMKMEVPHTAPVAGTVKAVHVANDQEGFDADVLAIELE